MARSELPPNELIDSWQYLRSPFWLAFSILAREVPNTRLTAAVQIVIAPGQANLVRRRAESGKLAGLHKCRRTDTPWVSVLLLPAAPGSSDRIFARGC